MKATSMDQSVILGAARTPFGKMGGSLASKPAVELGTIALNEAIARSGIDPAAITKVIFGQVLQGGAGQNPARQVSLAAGLDRTVTAETVNRVCGSGLLALARADNLIRLQEHQAIATGGMESMSQAPYFVRNGRFGYRMGPGVFEDLVQVDGLYSNIDHRTMGAQADFVAQEEQMTRERADAWALRSHRRAIAAIDADRFANEIVPVTVQQKKSTATVTTDEAPRRDTSAEALARLKPAFNADGLVTAGNAPGLNDGAGALIVASAEFARQHGLDVQATILGHADVAWDVPYLAYTPAMAAEKALQRAGVAAADVDLWEINEAFASVALISTARLGIDPERVNVNGGAIAIGHPLAASGPRLVMTLIEELRLRGGGTGVAAMCSGGGQGDAIVIRVN
jgi:acetyl-CoA C-acetyltransferase